MWCKSYPASKQPLPQHPPLTLPLSCCCPLPPPTDIVFLILIAVVHHHCSCSSPLLSSCSAPVHIVGLPAQIHWHTNCCYHRCCHLCSPLLDPKASVIRPYLHRCPFSLKLISLLIFIDAIPWQGSLISLVVGVLLDEGGPQHEEHSG